MKNGEKCYSTCGELFNYDTTDFDIGDTYYEGSIVVVNPSELLDSCIIDHILERMEEELYERCSDAHFRMQNKVYSTENTVGSVALQQCIDL